MDGRISNSERLQDVIDPSGGILSKTDRRYLRGELDFSKYDDPEAVERQQRYQMRQRIKSGLEDLILISISVSDEDLNQIFSSLHDWLDEIGAFSEEIGQVDPNLPDPPLARFVVTALLQLHYRAVGLEYLWFANREVERVYREQVWHQGLRKDGMYYEVDEPNIPDEALASIPLEALEEEFRRGKLPPEHAEEVCKALILGGHLGSREGRRVLDEEYGIVFRLPDVMAPGPRTSE